MVACCALDRTICDLLPVALHMSVFSCQKAYVKRADYGLIYNWEMVHIVVLSLWPHFENIWSIFIVTDDMKKDGRIFYGNLESNSYNC